MRIVICGMDTDQILKLFKYSVVFGDCTGPAVDSAPVLMGRAGWEMALDFPVPEPVYMGYGHDELKNAFNAVCNLADWKAPIDAEVYNREIRLMVAAIGYFTATTPIVTPVVDNPNMVRVQAAGYRNGPAGP